MKMSDGGTRIFRPCRSARLVHRARARCRSSASRSRRSPGRPARAARTAPAPRAPGLPSTRATHVLDGFEHVRQREHARRRECVVERREVHARDVERAEARQIDGVGLATQLARVIDANAQAAARSALRCARSSSARPAPSDSRRRARRPRSASRRWLSAAAARECAVHSAPRPMSASRRFIRMRLRVDARMRCGAHRAAADFAEALRTRGASAGPDGCRARR